MIDLTNTFKFRLSYVVPFYMSTLRTFEVKVVNSRIFHGDFSECLYFGSMDMTMQSALTYHDDL